MHKNKEDIVGLINLG